MKNNFLVDTNFLLALVLNTHPFHKNTKEFYNRNFSSSTFSICRSVQINFLRLLAQKIDRLYNPLTNTDAIITLNPIFTIATASSETRFI